MLWSHQKKWNKLLGNPICYSEQHLMGTKVIDTTSFSDFSPSLIFSSIINALNAAQVISLQQLDSTKNLDSEIEMLTLQQLSHPNFNYYRKKQHNFIFVICGIFLSPMLQYLMIFVTRFCSRNRKSADS